MKEKRKKKRKEYITITVMKNIKSICISVTCFNDCIHTQTHTHRRQVLLRVVDVLGTLNSKAKEK